VISILSSGIKRFTNGAMIQGIELTQVRKDLVAKKTRDTEREARRNRLNQRIQKGGVLSVENARKMVINAEEEARKKAEKVSIQSQVSQEELVRQSVFTAAKKARIWRLAGRLQPLYVKDSNKPGRLLKRI
jgi:hypothetical protein